MSLSKHIRSLFKMGLRPILIILGFATPLVAIYLPCILPYLHHRMFEFITRRNLLRLVCRLRNGLLSFCINICSNFTPLGSILYLSFIVYFYLRIPPYPFLPTCPSTMIIFSQQMITSYWYSS